MTDRGGRAYGKAQYKVVINHEEQFSVWYAERRLPRGWKETGFAGSREACLDHIEEVWTDMRRADRRRLALRLLQG